MVTEFFLKRLLCREPRFIVLASAIALGLAHVASARSYTFTKIAEQLARWTALVGARFGAGGRSDV